ncbi:MAG: segregation and condensation protein A [Verrucomicrobiales bacterium]
MEHKIQLDVFEGPLDLLLYLVRKEEVDIYEVNLTKIATQFVEYVEMMREFDLDVAGEFLVMASHLMFIKSRELLPKELQPEVTDEEDENDPRWELIRQLVEYKKFKDAAATLQVREALQESIYPRVPARPEFAYEGPALRPNVSIFDLVNAVSSILKRHNQRSQSRDVYAELWTVSEKIESIASILKERRNIRFSEIFAHMTHRTEVVVTFLALLELIRLKQIKVEQPEPFAEIEISEATSPPPPPLDETDSVKAPAVSEDSQAATQETETLASEDRVG